MPTRRSASCWATPQVGCFAADGIVGGSNTGGCDRANIMMDTVISPSALLSCRGAHQDAAARADARTLCPAAPALHQGPRCVCSCIDLPAVAGMDSRVALSAANSTAAVHRIQNLKLELQPPDLCNLLCAASLPLQTCHAALASSAAAGGRWSSAPRAASWCRY